MLFGGGFKLLIVVFHGYMITIGMNVGTRPDVAIKSYFLNVVGSCHGVALQNQIKIVQERHVMIIKITLLNCVGTPWHAPTDNPF